MQSRWIGFSEDDGLIDRRRRRYDQAAEPQLVTQRVEDNPFHLYARACGASRIAPWLQHHPCYPRHPWLKFSVEAAVSARRTDSSCGEPAAILQFRRRHACHYSPTIFVLILSIRG